ncbi:precorrin-6Y C5,15-methyltransferase (decarboxylating) [Pseudobutyrivibrio ruminis]|uniref:tRNA (guanine(46)-N(7))-methyltransferase n=1 Tax=Pseudobutyrivibrio ruminis TaxID=46206 RepID=A0A1H7GDL5_9FIRM|nr:bifunctional cobalt-precorrin-7 (C(5))-methyltransferase/cobalt-precorrin-6B (C(15))-methyltransferase [Pseudobutyrivibrio ruminis]SEK36211.1 precorrin-6Y C5,15-methyltransferase (decarboxylating) [Pseudobutyrivibrio ruminis]
MKKVIIFGGTTEGRILAESLAHEQIGSVYCVATEYGKQQLESSEYIQVRSGRMDFKEMAKLFSEVNPDAIIDATHPFAEVVKQEIESAIFAYKDVPFFRVVRDEDNVDYSNCTFFDTTEECAAALERINGKIFLTTGSKELAVFCKNESIRERIIARVIPSEESIRICSENGLKGSQIIAMQGPFSAGMNLSFLRESEAKVLVMKEGGKASGEAARIVAANKAQIPTYIIRRPEEKVKGYSLFETRDKVLQLFGIKSTEYGVVEGVDTKIYVTLAGFGMGFGSITAEVEQAILEADYILGAPRMLVGIETDSKKFPYYLAKDIVPKLSELAADIKFGTKKAVVLFSGDTGFYSGAKKLKEALDKEPLLKANILPGISSISALAARIGESWQDAKLLSTHGVEEQLWMPLLTEQIKHNEKVFVITSGSKDVRAIGEILKNLDTAGTPRFSILVGTNLYADEKVQRLSIDKCGNFNEDGLSTVFIKNNKPEAKVLTPGLLDVAFDRDKVPMSKEEIRALSICKLQITKNAVCYDIGSGSGSVAVEMGLLDSSVQVYAVEFKPEACQLIQKNIDKFGLKNVHLISGIAPDSLHDLPAPTHVFIGGSGGRLEDILQVLMKYEKPIKVVINSVTIETIAEINSVIKKYNFNDVDVVQIAVSKAKKAGDYNILQGQNPVYIATFTL